MAEVGSEEVARDPEVRALRARLKQAERELDILKKALASWQEKLSPAAGLAMVGCIDKLKPLTTKTKYSSKAPFINWV